VKKIALTAGASAPECLVEETVKFLATEGIRQRAGTRSHAGER
jgi:4-hydroxy-3-methylbut-2-enyl diphosphate reductase IspH